MSEEGAVRDFSAISEDRQLVIAAQLISGCHFQDERWLFVGDWSVSIRPDGLLGFYVDDALVEVVNPANYTRASWLALALRELADVDPEGGDGLPDLDDSRGFA